MKKRILSAFLVLCMMLTMIPTAALAAEDPGGGSGSDRVHTESNDGVVVDKTVNYDGDGNYSLTLEAYVTNEVTKGSKTTPGAGLVWVDGSEHHLVYIRGDI